MVASLFLKMLRAFDNHQTLKWKVMALMGEQMLWKKHMELFQELPMHTPQPFFQSWVQERCATVWTTHYLASFFFRFHQLYQYDVIASCRIEVSIIEEIYVWVEWRASIPMKQQSGTWRLPLIQYLNQFAWIKKGHGIKSSAPYFYCCFAGMHCIYLLSANIQPNVGANRVFCAVESWYGLSHRRRFGARALSK